jgi:D-psicose/D-tagatose/L-ribulose 3-epimerase
MTRLGVDLMLWTGSFNSKTDIKLIGKVARMGFDGVELPLFNTQTVNVKDTAKALKDAGLGCTACTVLSPQQNLVDDSPKARQAGIDHLKLVLEMIAEMGGDGVSGPEYSAVGRLVGRGRTQKEWDRCVQSLRKVAPTAEATGVMLGIEPINRFETYFLNTQADAARLCKEVGSPKVKVHYDTFHANIEEQDPVGALRKLGKALGHFHACENDRGIPGTGHVDWDGTFKALKDIKYKGWLTIESFVPAIKELAAAAAIWRPLAKSGDELASKGLVFLRKMVKQYGLGK